MNIIGSAYQLKIEQAQPPKKGGAYDIIDHLVADVNYFICINFCIRRELCGILRKMIMT